MNTRNRTKAILIVIAAPLCLASTLSFADPTTAMDACVKAFVRTSLPQDRAVTVQTETPLTTSLVQKRPYAIVLSAVGKQSGKRLAKATCLVGRDGTAIALNGKPLPTPTLAETKVALGGR